MSFGLTNAPATFQAVMNTLFAQWLRQFVLVFVDDILVYSKSLEDHLQHLHKVFQILSENQLFIKQSKCPTKWSQWLAQAEFWYNTTHHSTLGTTPFEVLYGHPPRHFGITSGDHSVVPELEEWLQNRAVMSDLIRQHLLRAQQKMKHQADKKRSVREFQVGDWVYLKLQPYVQFSLAHRSNQKLCFK